MYLVRMHFISWLLLAATLFAQTDSRLISTGRVIPDEGYSDQPYIVKTDDGAWLCVITTGPGVEGAGGQHVVTRRSMDRGQTWAEAVDVEPRDGPEASYAVLLKVPSGRADLSHTGTCGMILRSISHLSSLTAP